MTLFRLGAAALLLASLPLAGCDTTSVPDPADTTVDTYDGIIEVSLVGTSPTDLALRLVAVEDQGCSRDLYTSFASEPTVRRFTVDGIGPLTDCDAVFPAEDTVAFDLGPTLPSTYDIEVVHAGATDLYTLDLTGPAPVLIPVTTQTTRPGGGADG